MKNRVETLVVDNFRGKMTQFVNGDINSGLSNIFETSGNNPFLYFGRLTWYADPVQIDSGGSVITDLIMAMKERVESGVLYVYAIGHTGRLYKIQVNDPASFDPDYDNPVLLATLSAQSPTFTRGGFIDFYGATERIYIGHDKGVTRIDFDGTNETFVGTLGSWTQNVPRPLKQFTGKLYIGNGSNIAEIDTTATVTSYTKLSPGFPDNTQVRDMDVATDGNYLHTIVTRLPLADITSTTQDTTITANAESYIFKWNGIDTGYTAYDTFPSYSLGANIVFGQYQYTFGSDQFGGAVFNPVQKIVNEPEIINVLPNAIASTGNLLSWMGTIYYDGNLYGIMQNWGTLDHENPNIYFSSIFLPAAGDETDVLRIPCQLPVSNFGFGASTNGYSGNVFGTSKIYFSTLESSDAPTTGYKLYKWVPVYSPSAPQGTPTAGLYQTQTQLFSERVQIKEVRVYGKPWVANNDFTVDIVGSDGTPISGASKSFVAGTNLTIGDDTAMYTPQAAPTYAMALRITNDGTANFVINKVEIDYAAGGQ